MKIILNQDYACGAVRYPKGTVLDAPCSVALRLMESGEASGVSVKAQAVPFGYIAPAAEPDAEPDERPEGDDAEASVAETAPPRTRTRGGRRTAQT